MCRKTHPVPKFLWELYCMNTTFRYARKLKHSSTVTLLGCIVRTGYKELQMWCYYIPKGI